MFVQADVVVKAVMIGLALASVATWTVLLVKTIQLQAARREGLRALATVLSARSLLEAARQIADQGNAVGRLLAAAEDEVEKSRGLPAEGIKERIAWQLERIEAAAAQQRQKPRRDSVRWSMEVIASSYGCLGALLEPCLR